MQASNGATGGMGINDANDTSKIGVGYLIPVNPTTKGEMLLGKRKR